MHFLLQSKNKDEFSSLFFIFLHFPHQIRHLQYLVVLLSFDYYIRLKLQVRFVWLLQVHRQIFHIEILNADYPCRQKFEMNYYPLKTLRAEMSFEAFQQCKLLLTCFHARQNHNHLLCLQPKMISFLFLPKVFSFQQSVKYLKFK